MPERQQPNREELARQFEELIHAILPEQLRPPPRRRGRPPRNNAITHTNGNSNDNRVGNIRSVSPEEHIQHTQNILPSSIQPIPDLRQSSQEIQDIMSRIVNSFRPRSNRTTPPPMTQEEINHDNQPPLSPNPYNLNVTQDPNDPTRINVNMSVPRPAEHINIAIPVPRACPSCGRNEGHTLSCPVITPITAEPEGEIANQEEPQQISSPSDETFFDTERSFGTEFEFLMPLKVSKHDLISELTRAGILSAIESYNHHSRPHWKLVSDRSVINTIPQYHGFNELVSPILWGHSGLTQIKTVCKVLTKLECKVNKHCGLHVHHCLIRRNESPVATIHFNVAKNAILIYNRYKKIFSQMMPPSRTGNYYCRYWSPSELNKLKSAIKPEKESRYKVVNLKAVQLYGTLEFRQHAGSTDFKKVINWIKITQAIIRRARELHSESLLKLDKKIENELKLKKDLSDYIYNRIATIKERTSAERNLGDINVLRGHENPSLQERVEGRTDLPNPF